MTGHGRRTEIAIHNALHIRFFKFLSLLVAGHTFPETRASQSELADAGIVGELLPGVNF